jgi:transcriptional regulator with PAS, ATPase and Fis domain
MMKTDVRIVVATNVTIPEAIEKGKFRQDLYYRLNTVPIIIPPLRERKQDIFMLFKRFSIDFAEKYRMPPLQLSDDAIVLLENYRWPGNIRQLKNVTEQISIIEKQKYVSAEVLKRYLPQDATVSLPVLYNKEREDEKISERDLLYKVLFDMKKDIIELKKTVSEILEHDLQDTPASAMSKSLVKNYNSELLGILDDGYDNINIDEQEDDQLGFQPSEVIDENLSLEKKEIDMIKRALSKHYGKRKNAARELGISERTLYRKIKEYNIDQ